MSANGFSTDDIAELINIKIRQDKEKEGKNKSRQPSATTYGGAGKKRTFAKPVKPIFEGKTVAEAMRRHSDHSQSTTNSMKLQELDSDEISLSSVQNMPVVPSMSESPGFMRMITRFRRKKKIESPRIGELPNKKRLQVLAEKQQVVTTDVIQASGTSTKQSNNRNPNSPKSQAGSWGRDSFGLFRGGDIGDLMKVNNDSTGAQSLNDDDSFFAAMDTGDDDSDSQPPQRPASMSSLPSLSSSSPPRKERHVLKGKEKARERRTQRGKRESGLQESFQEATDGSATSSSYDVISFQSPTKSPLQSNAGLDWIPIVKSKAFLGDAGASPTVEPSDHSRAELDAAFRPLSKEAKMLQEATRMQKEQLAAALSQTAHSVESIDNSQMEVDDEETKLAAEKREKEWHDAVTEDPTKAHSKNLDSHDEDDDSDDELKRAIRPLSKEAQKLQAANRKQRDQVRTVLSQTADSTESLHVENHLSTAEDVKKEMEKRKQEWHDATGDATGRVHAKHIKKELRLFNEPKERPKMKGKKSDLGNFFPQIEKAVESSLGDISRSMPSLANFTVQSDDLDISTDTFSKQFEVHTAGGKATIIDDTHYSKKDTNEPFMLLAQSKSSMEGSGITEVPLCEIDDETPPEKGPDWQRVIPHQKPHFDYRAGQTYKQKESPKKKSGPNLSATLERKEKDPLNITTHSGDSSMGESYMMADVPSIYGGSTITTNLSMLKEAPDRSPRPERTKVQGGATTPSTPDGQTKAASSPKRRKNGSKKSSPKRNADAGPDFSWHRVSIDKVPLESKGGYAEKESKAGKDRGRMVETGSRKDRKPRGKGERKAQDGLETEKNWHSVDVQNSTDREDYYPTKEASSKDPASQSKETSDDPLFEEESDYTRPREVGEFQVVSGAFEGINIPRRESTQLYKEEPNPDKDTKKAARSSESEEGKPKEASTESQAKRSEEERTAKRSPKETRRVEKRKEDAENSRTTGSNKRGQSGKPRSSSDKRSNGARPGEQSADRRKNTSEGKSRSAKTDTVREKDKASTQSGKDDSQGSSGSGKESVVDGELERSGETSNEASSRSTTNIDSEADKADNGNMPSSPVGTQGQEQGPISSSPPGDEPFAQRPPEAGPFARRPPEAGPFAWRPPEAGPFAERPMTPDDDDIGSEPSSPGCLSIQSVPDDDDIGSEPSSPGCMSTQSVDRHIVSDSSHRSLLRQQVDDRRQALASILQKTRSHTLDTENELLDLKRKLALSQALVQQLEVENAEIHRQAVLDIAKAQLSLLDQRNNREKQLEKTIKDFMAERNAAVQECHELRILIMGSCNVCRRRFEDKEYVMDNSTRDTIMSKRRISSTAAFEWFTGDLASENRNPKVWGTGEHAVALNTLNDTETSLATDTNSVLTGNMPTFMEAPMQWLSEKIFLNTQDATNQKNDDPHLIEEVITYQRIPGNPKTNNVNADNLLEGLETENKQVESTEETVGDEGANPGSRVLSAGVEHGEEIGAPVDGGQMPVNDPWSAKTEDSQNATETGSWSQGSQPAPTKKKNRFFSRLLGEQVQDEFSSIAVPQANTAMETKKEGKKKFSLFASLMDERVEEDAAFAGIDPALSIIPQSKQRQGSDTGLQSATKGRTKFGDRLKNEQVLDDMEIFNSLMSISEHKSRTTDGNVQSNSSSAPKKKGLFRFKDEKFDDDDRDIRILIASKEGAETSRIESANAPKRKGLLGLKDEKLDDDDRDSRMLKSFKKGEEATRNDSNNSGKKNGLQGLSDKKFDDDDHDDQIFNLLKESGETSKHAMPTTGFFAQQDGSSVPSGDFQQQTIKSKRASRARELLKGERLDDDTSFLNSSPVANVSPTPPGFASPFSVADASPRRRPTSNKGRRGSTTVTNYRGRFSGSIKRLPSLTDGDIPGPAPLLDEDEEMGSTRKWSDQNVDASPKKRNTRDSMMNHTPLDVEIMGERPWRRDTGKKPSITLPTIDVEGSSEAGETNEIFEDSFNHLATLMEKEGADWN